MLFETRDTNPELLVLLDEYKSMREALLSLQGFSRQLSYYSYTGLGIIMASIFLIRERNLQILFLIFPFLFLFLSMASVKYVIASLNLNNYINENINPRIRILLSEENNKKDFSKVLIWDEKMGVSRKYPILLIPMAGAQFAVVLFSALFSFTAYFYFPPDPRPHPTIELILITINIVSFLYCVSLGVIAGVSKGEFFNIVFHYKQ